MVEAAGGHITGLSQMKFDEPHQNVWNVRTGLFVDIYCKGIQVLVALEACLELGVSALVSPEDIAHPENNDHLGKLQYVGGLNLIMKPLQA